MEHSDPGRPIRVVLFGGGPVLEPGVKRFMNRLVEHPEIDFLGAFCQSQGHSHLHVFRDLWRRRRLLAIPLFLMNLVANSNLFRPNRRNEVAINSIIAQLSGRIHFVPDIHTAEVLDQVRLLKPDLGLIYSSPILKPVLFEIPTLGTLGIHHGKLPGYRGKKTTFWALYNNEETAAVTIQKVNAGLDTGAIVRQGEVPAQGRSLSEVWRDLEALGLDLYLQAILEVKRGTASYTPQAGMMGKLYRDPKFTQILAFWLKQFFRRSKSILRMDPRVARPDRGISARDT